MNVHAKSRLTPETSADTPVRNQGPGRSLPGPGRGPSPARSHRRGGVPDGPAEQPLHPVRGQVPGLLGQRPPFRRGIWLISAAAYLPACSHGSTRAKHGRSRPISSARFRRASPAPILTAAAASGFVVFTRIIARRLPCAKTAARSAAGQTLNGCCRTRRSCESWRARPGPVAGPPRSRGRRASA